MNRSGIAILGVIALARSAAAQAPGQVEPASAPFLEKRVPEELAAEGVVLSRRHLALQVEALADRWLVSLVDLTTGRVAASTKVDQLPADREAAVAAMTHVVAELAAQIVNHGEPPPAAPAQVPAVVEDRAERAAREVAELRFKRQALRFGASYAVSVTDSTLTVSRRWLVFQGDVDQVLEPEDFYTTLGRSDLAEAYHRRRTIMVGSLVVSGLAFAAATVAFIAAIPRHEDCQLGPTFSMCVQDNAALSEKGFPPSMAPALVLLGVAMVGIGVGGYYYARPHPVEENDAKSLADAYNQRLRRQLGLPVAMRRPVFHDVKLVPYAGGHDGGLVLGARF